MPDGLASMWRRVRLELLKLAEGRTARLDKGPPPAEPDRTPPAAGQDLRYFDRRWENAKTDVQRRKVIDDAIEFLRLHHQTKRDASLYYGTEEWEIAVARESLETNSVRPVARKYNIAPQTVCNYVSKHGAKVAA